MKASDAGLVTLCLAAILSGCDVRPSTTQPLPPAPMTKEQLAELERSGVLPQLDRSTDIAGPDADNNGIRDDIDAYIAALPVREPLWRAEPQVV